MADPRVYRGQCRGKEVAIKQYSATYFSDSKNGFVAECERYAYFASPPPEFEAEAHNVATFRIIPI